MYFLNQSTPEKFVKNMIKIALQKITLKIYSNLKKKYHMITIFILDCLKMTLKMTLIIFMEIKT